MLCAFIGSESGPKHGPLTQCEENQHFMKGGCAGASSLARPCRAQDRLKYGRD